MVRIYYGISGTLKMTTIERFEGVKILSANKPYKRISQELLGTSPNDLELGVFRLVQLENLRKLNPETDYHVERGITDFLEFWTSRPGNEGLRESGEFIEPWVKLESKLLPGAKKILLRMEDQDFISSKVLQDPYRRQVLPDLDTYLKRQEDYVKFTKTWNRFDQEIIIKDANQYLMNIEKWIN